MKILFLTPRDSKTNLGGVERHVRLLTEELERRGNRVKELSLEEADKDYKGYKDYKNSDDNSILSGAFFKFRAWGYLWARRDLLGWADIIHVHDVFWWVMLFVPLIWLDKCYKSYKAYKSFKESPCRSPRRILFTTFHGWEGAYPPTRSAVWQKKLAARLCDGTIGVGSFYRKWYGVRPNRVVWGVLDKGYKSYKDYKNQFESSNRETPWHTPRSHPIFAFFGRLEEVNGVEMVIEAAKRLNKSYKDYKSYKKRDEDFIKDSPWHSPGRILFVGDGSFRKQAEGIGKVTGMVEEPWKYLAEADVVIASSYLAILEAAAMGKRIIAVANNPLKRDYLEGHPLRDYFKIVESVEELVGEITDKSYKGYKNYKENREWAKRWAMRQTSGRLADEYEELWKSKSA